MGTRLKVEVGERDVAWGVKGDSSRCVVARAIARTVPDATRIEVDTQTIRYTSHGRRWAFLTPLTVQNYVADFDAGRNIDPFAFWLSNPIRLRRRNTIEEDKPKQAKRAAAAREDKKAAAEAAAKGEPAPKKTTVGMGVGIRTDRSEGHPPPPRVFKLKKRTYGARQLRINQAQVGSMDDGDPLAERIGSVVKILDDLAAPDDVRFDKARRMMREANASEDSHVVRYALRIRRERIK